VFLHNLTSMTEIADYGVLKLPMLRAPYGSIGMFQGDLIFHEEDDYLFCIRDLFTGAELTVICKNDDRRHPFWVVKRRIAHVVKGYDGIFIRWQPCDPPSPPGAPKKVRSLKRVRPSPVIDLTGSDEDTTEDESESDDTVGFTRMPQEMDSIATQII
jgi:hypothetical protein